MQVFSIPRTDLGAEGIEVLWTWPDSLPLSAHGYDVLRLDSQEFRSLPTCETITEAQIAALRSSIEIGAPLGALRLRTSAKLKHLTDALQIVSTAAPGDHISLGTSLLSAIVVPSAQASEFNAHMMSAVVSSTIDEFIQELKQPTNQVTIAVDARAALGVALVNGKAVASGMCGPAPATLTLSATGIDTIVIYTVAPKNFTICTYSTVVSDKDPWQHATIIAKGLTLPIVECDPTLVTPAQEYSTAKSRLVGTETLDPVRFARMCATLRAPAGAKLGPSGTQLSLNRSDTSQSFEEITFDQQLASLVLHPKVRRVLGFGYHDRTVVAGKTYLYRVVGHFDAADLADTIYDFHRIPAATVLPDTFSIRDVNFRFQLPVKVVLGPAPGGKDLNTTSRRGILIDSEKFDSSWLLPFYDKWSTLITLPHPVTRVVLEVGEGHHFSYAAGLPWSFGVPTPTPLPPGPRVELSFVTPVQELRLSGRGVLYALRLPCGTKGTVDVHADTPEVTFAAAPLPAPPLQLVATNLQQPAVGTLTGTIDESTHVPPRPQIGVRLNWLPAPIGNLPIWPDDLESGPPLDAMAFVIEHRTVTYPSTYGPWEPISSDDNLTFGSRDLTPTDMRLEKGCDLDELFPANRPRTNAGLLLTFSDVFGQKDPTTGTIRQAQPLGSLHQYRIRAMDAAGRISGGETLSNVVRLEQHQPPPLPVGPQQQTPDGSQAPVVDANGQLITPPGPRARAIVRGGLGLSADDLTILGAHENAIILEWGWRQAERDLDPYTAEFRVYATQPADTVSGEITAVNSAPPYWRLTLSLTNLSLQADELAGQWITSNGYPFLIVHNDAGTTPTLLVEMPKVKTSVQPKNGVVTFGRPLRPEHQSPAGWDQRVQIYTLTADQSYQHVFYDLLKLDETHPRDSIWVGVSAADAQPYVPDQRSAGPLANRPGNESAIVTCAITERYRGQPVFSVSPPLGDVPEVLTEEPTGRQVLVTLDLEKLLNGALPVGNPVALARCGADEILARTSVSGSQVVLTHPDGTTQVIAFPAADVPEVLSILNGPNPQRLPNRYLLHLIAAANEPSAFFTRPNADIVTVWPTTDRLAPKPGRFLYFLHKADALGHVSGGGALLPVVVRVPSIAPAAAPVRQSLGGKANKATLTVSVPPDDDTAVVLLFAAITPPGTKPAPQHGAELLRVPNRPDLYPNDGLRLLLADGTLLSPAMVKKLDDADVVVEANGTRITTLALPVQAGAWATLWSFALTGDGQPSRPCGPFGQGVSA